MSSEHIPAESAPKKHEIVLRGSPAAPGLTLGKVYVFKKETPRVMQWAVEQEKLAEELERLDRAIARSEKELTKILDFAKEKIGDLKAKIFEAQVMVLHDEFLLDSIRKRLRSELKNAEYIVSDEIGKYAGMMFAASDEYMHERAHDVEDLKFRIIRNLQHEKLFSRLEEQVIIVSHSLTPADTIILSRNSVLGYATDLGGITSHAALLSASLKIPAVVGLRDVSRSVSTGDMMILDGYSGTVIIHPDEKRIEEFKVKRDHFLHFESQLAQLKDLPAKTIDGRSVELSANIEFQEEIEYVVVQGSQGIGLYRTETLLFNRDDFPSEEEQYREYKQVADRIYPHRVIMRTFDVGGDKIAPEMANEDNPFLGWRGIRMMLDRPDLFLDQLRAMLRASTRKNLAIMFPMIATVEELRKAKAFIQKAKDELRAKKIRFDTNIKIGTMVEVPSAAFLIDRIAPETDFLSIGSNDLTQYLLAVDRNNTLVQSLYREFDPSVIATIKHIIATGRKTKKWVGICGEMASNPLAVLLLVGLGIDELSVIPSLLPEIKKIIRSINYRELQYLAESVLELDNADAIEAKLTEFLRKECPDIPLKKEGRV